MTNDTIDFEQDLKTGDINRIIEKAREMYKLNLKINETEKILKKLKEDYALIEGEELPSIMAEETNADELAFDNGYKLILKNVVAGSIPSESAIKRCKNPEEREELIDRRNNCFKWLRENNAGSLIANNLIVNVPKSEDGEKHAAKIEAFISKLGLTPLREESVHHQTLNSYLKEQINSEENKEIPFDTFKIFTGKKAVIQAPKK